MSNLQMFSYRITKYDPKNRNNLGHYKMDEWIAISDIGQIYNGKRVSKTEYFKAENAYVKTIIIFMDFLKVKYLPLSYFEKHFDRLYAKRYCTKAMQELYKLATTGSELNKQQVCDMARLALRELVWECPLENKDMFVHFGWDYYMYIGSSKELTQDLRNKIENLGLFVEDFESPYLHLDE